MTSNNADANGCSTVNGDITSANGRGVRNSDAPSALPEGWKELRSKDDRVYYYHKSTGQTQWGIPVAVDSKADGSTLSTKVRSPPLLSGDMCYMVRGRRRMRGRMRRMRRRRRSSGVARRGP